MVFIAEQTIVQSSRLDICSSLDDTLFDDDNRNMDFLA